MSYITATAEAPRRSYYYATGKLEIYRNNSQMVITAPDAITDSLTSRAKVTGLQVTLSNIEGAADTVMAPVSEELEEREPFIKKGERIL